MDEAVQEYLRLGAEKRGFALDREQIRQFTVYSELLVQWNEKMNLTAITEEREIIGKHFLDSLAGGVAVSYTHLDRDGTLLFNICLQNGFDSHVQVIPDQGKFSGRCVQ